MRLQLPAPNDFSFVSAVCSHGFFMLAPNRWHPGRRVLETTIGMGDGGAVTATVRATRDGGGVVVTCPDRLNRSERDSVRRAVIRMLRLDEDLVGFHDMCRKSGTHRAAADQRFGRLLRGATFFEDLIKVICTCNVTWSQTVAMVGRLVEHWGPASAGATGFAFPTAEALTRVSPAEMRSVARVGYRAAFISRLARAVADGDVDERAYENADGSGDLLFDRLLELPGVGAYAAGHLCMLLGRYDRLAIDTEMMRFLRQRYPRRRWTPAAIRRHYDRWQPYQFLAYWFELWQDYVGRHGDPAGWDRRTVGPNITRKITAHGVGTGRPIQAKT